MTRRIQGARFLALGSCPSPMGVEGRYHQQVLFYSIDFTDYGFPISKTVALYIVNDNNFRIVSFYTILACFILGRLRGVVLDRLILKVSCD